MKQAIVLLFLVRSSLAVIYSLNESDYNRMPTLYELDDYSSCLLEPGGTYCVADFHLFSTEQSALMNMIEQYSAHTMKHFNHTQIHRGICVKKTCAEFQKNRSLDETHDLEETLEACLNDSMWRGYRLQAKLQNIEYCKRSNDKMSVDSSDIVVAVVYVILLALNAIGSFYDILVCRKRHKQGNPYLLAFSIQRNWEKLVTPSGKGPDPRLERLKLFNGMRTVTMICVFFSHTVLIMAYSYVNNPVYIEQSYEDPAKQILYNGNLVTQTFFVMSSFLLAFNLQVHAEKHKISLIQWPKGMLLRWLRLTPTYALMLATISTWMRHLSSGPLWDHVVVTEALACRRYWWAHLLYINNYIYDDSMCTPQTCVLFPVASKAIASKPGVRLDHDPGNEYLAADTQLFCVGLLLCVAARSRRARCTVLLLTFIGSVAALGLHTYFQDLDAVVKQAPEMFRELYSHDNTFRLLYIRGHTNLSTYTIGLAGGFLAFHWLTKGKDFTKLKGYRLALWLAFPLGVAVILSGGLFYTDGPRPSMTIRVVYATLYKPVFQVLVVTIILGCMFKLDTLYRGVLEWRGWTWMGRVSYSAFLLHTLFQRGFIGALTQPIHMSDYYVFTVLASTILLSYVCGAGLWLLVEAPAAALTRTVLAPPRAPPREKRVEDLHKPRSGEEGE